MGRSKALLFFLSGLVALSNGLNPNDIQGGQYASPGEFKYQVSVQIYGLSYCGGSIISNYWILTAGHCAKHPSLTDKPIKVVAGVQDVNSQSSQRVVADVITAYLPKRYLQNNLYAGNHVRLVADIAMFKLKQSLNLESNRHLEKLTLPNAGLTYANEMAKISGFGWQTVQVEYDQFLGSLVEVNGSSDGRLRFGNVRIVSDQECSRYYQIKNDGVLCAQLEQRQQNGREGLCTGDSGGPLVVNGNTVVGVVSTSPLGCQEDVRPAIYTRVTSYLNFINDVLNGVMNDVHVQKIPIG